MVWCCTAYRLRTRHLLLSCNYLGYRSFSKSYSHFTVEYANRTVQKTGIFMVERHVPLLLFLNTFESLSGPNCCLFDQQEPAQIEQLFLIFRIIAVFVGITVSKPPGFGIFYMWEPMHDLDSTQVSHLIWFKSRTSRGILFTNRF